MKKLIFTLLLLFSVTLLMSQGLKAKFDKACFYNPEQGSYVETYLSIDMNGLSLLPIDGDQYQGQVNILLIFKRNDSIVNFSKTQIDSPIVDDTTEVNFSFIDQQRFFLPNGDYILELEFSDANADNEPRRAKMEVQLDYNAETLAFSDFELLESYEESTGLKVNTKNGFDMVPRVSTFFADHNQILTYYLEIYNLNKKLGDQEKLLLTTYISQEDSGSMVDNLVLRKKIEAQEVNVVLSQFYLSKLSSGNYYLTVELRDKNNNFLEGRKTFFQVSNKDVQFDEKLLAKVSSSNSFVEQFPNDSLTILIESVFPIADAIERAFIKHTLKTANENQKRKFLLYFWQEVDPYNPENAWRTYQLEVMKTNNSFGNKYTPGYATDMGRVYLQYGPPNTIVDQEYDTGGLGEYGSVPYQIWHYYEIGDKRDGKFVFYNPHLIHKGYDLLHSNVVGEINNPHWQTYLHRNQLENIDAPENDRYDGKSGELYNNPR